MRTVRILCLSIAFSFFRLSCILIGSKGNFLMGIPELLMAVFFSPYHIHLFFPLGLVKLFVFRGLLFWTKSTHCIVLERPCLYALFLRALYCTFLN